MADMGSMREVKKHGEGQPWVGTQLPQKATNLAEKECGEVCGLRQEFAGDAVEGIFLPPV
jgi:hypothetical protein